jgi:ABC-type transport system involved in cytochrome bd biosynthesis fused ATPase/permease subunit
MRKILVEIFQDLTRKEKIFLIQLSVFQILISMVEVFAILVSGFAGVVAISQITGQKNYYSANIFEFSNTQFLSALLFLSATLLISKTIFSIKINSKVINFYSNMTGRITNEKLEDLNYVNYTWIRNENPAKVSYFFGQGLNGDYKNIHLGFYYLANEIIFITIIVIYLTIINLAITLVIFTLFILAAGIMHKSIGGKYKLYGQQEVILISRNNSLIAEMLNSYAELTVADKMRNFQFKLKQSRSEENKVRAKLQSLEQIPKYILEVLIILVGLILFAAAAIPSNALYGSSTILIFGLALTRMAPSLLRAQNGLTLFKQYSERFDITKKFFEDFNSNKTKIEPANVVTENVKLSTKVELQDISFSHDGKFKLLKNFSAEFSSGKVNCIQGTSGIGKSTLAEIILGFHMPKSGTVKIGGQEPLIWQKINPGGIYFLPQDPLLIDSTVLENITLDSDDSEPVKIKAELILRKVGLAKFEISDLVLRNKIKLSGGEKQKLGVARALYSGAKILILDEPTSSMDKSSERQIFELLVAASKKTNIILITHSPQANTYFSCITRL